MVKNFFERTFSIQRSRSEDDFHRISYGNFKRMHEMPEELVFHCLQVIGWLAKETEREKERERQSFDFEPLAIDSNWCGWSIKNAHN